MSRRRIIGWLGAGALLLAAGCSSSEPEPDGSPAAKPNLELAETQAGDEDLRQRLAYAEAEVRVLRHRLEEARAEADEAKDKLDRVSRSRRELWNWIWENVPDAPASPPVGSDGRSLWPPPPAVDWAYDFETVDELAEKSTLVAVGEALEEPVPERGCRIKDPGPGSSTCWFQRFQVKDVVAGSFIDGTATPQTIDLRIWAQDQPRIDRGHSYLLFLYPFEYVPGEWFGDYQTPAGWAGVFRETRPGVFHSFGGVPGTSVEEVKELLEARPGLLGSKVERAR